ncbi:hypothetical protein BDQ17DRAFT_1326531 [Cyathus striatus]|nr:hypothetical protein BDQ17DRAFT_1326531 [Cyathus striatus]
MARFVFPPIQPLNYNILLVPVMVTERALLGAIGDVQCNAARLKTVASLTATQAAVSKLANAASGDEATTSAVSTAQTGLKSAQGGIGQIALALATGQDPPASGRQQVQDGLQSAQTALNNINSTDSSITSATQNALNSLNATISAGSDVVSDCPGSSSQ